MISMPHLSFWEKVKLVKDGKKNVKDYMKDTKNWYSIVKFVTFL